MITSRINENCVNPTTNLVNLLLSTGFGLHFLLIENAKHISQKAISISPHNNIVLNRDLTKKFQIELWKGGPVSGKSFRDEEVLVARISGNLSKFNRTGPFISFILFMV